MTVAGRPEVGVDSERRDRDLLPGIPYSATRSSLVRTEIASTCAARRADRGTTISKIAARRRPMTVGSRSNERSCTVRRPGTGRPGGIACTKWASSGRRRRSRRGSPSHPRLLQARAQLDRPDAVRDEVGPPRDGGDVEVGRAGGAREAARARTSRRRCGSVRDSRRRRRSRCASRTRRRVAAPTRPTSSRPRVAGRGPQLVAACDRLLDPRDRRDVLRLDVAPQRPRRPPPSAAARSSRPARRTPSPRAPGCRSPRRATRRRAAAPAIEPRELVVGGVADPGHARPAARRLPSRAHPRRAARRRPPAAIDGARFFRGSSVPTAST